MSDGGQSTPPMGHGRKIVIAEPMEFRTRVFIALLGLAVLVFVVNLVRTRRLKEEYALLWLFTAIVLVLAPLFIDVVDAISYALGILYPPAFIFLIALICVLFILFQFSVTISRFSEQIKVLTQDVALLAKRVQELQGSIRSEKEQDDASEQMGDSA